MSAEKLLFKKKDPEMAIIPFDNHNVHKGTGKILDKIEKYLTYGIFYGFNINLTKSL